MISVNLFSGLRKTCKDTAMEIGDLIIFSFDQWRDDGEGHLSKYASRSDSGTLIDITKTCPTQYLVRLKSGLEIWCDDGDIENAPESDCPRTYCLWQPGIPIPELKCSYYWTGKEMPMTGDQRCFRCRRVKPGSDRSFT